MIRLILISFLLLTTSSFASEKPFVRVRWKNSKLLISYKNKQMTYNYGDPKNIGGLFLYAIDKVKTEYLAENDAVVYMILDVQGPSRGPEGAMSQCGAGTEAAKILFAFNSNGEMREPKIALYQSCWKTVESDMEDSEVTNAIEEMTVAKFETYIAGSRGHVITKSVLTRFDPENPKQGFISTEACTDGNPSDRLSKPESVACPK